jgi:hypothetical protein
MNMPKVVMTWDFLWDPNFDSHAEAESMMTAVTSTVNYVPDPLNFELDDTVRHILAIETHERVIPEYDDDDEEPLDLYHRLIANVVVAPDDIPGHGLEGHHESSVYIQHDKLRQIGKLTSSERLSILTPEILSTKWKIGLGTAKRTLQVTTQQALCNVFMPGERRLRQQTNHLRFPTLKGKFYHDTMFCFQVSIRNGYKCAQIYTDGHGFDFFYPMVGESGKKVAQTLTQFIHDNGIPKELITDCAQELIAGEV